MRSFVYVNPSDADERVIFWKNFLKLSMKFFHEQGLERFEDLKKFDARKVLDEPLWKLPEINGKYHGRYYSRDVWERTLKENELPSKLGGRWNESRAVLVLEHVVERASLLRWLFEDTSRIDLIDQVCVGCVVSKDEDSRLPRRREVDPNNLWQRYLEAKIDVYDRELQRWHILDGKVCEQ